MSNLQNPKLGEIWAFDPTLMSPPGTVIGTTETILVVTKPEHVEFPTDPQMRTVMNNDYIKFKGVSMTLGGTRDFAIRKDNSGNWYKVS